MIREKVTSDNWKKKKIKSPQRDIEKKILLMT